MHINISTNDHTKCSKLVNDESQIILASEMYQQKQVDSLIATKMGNSEYEWC